MDRTIDLAQMQTLDLPRDGHANGNQRCCTRLNKLIWRNEAELLKMDHLKAAPCVSTKFLAILRMIISLALIA